MVNIFVLLQIFPFLAQARLDILSLGSILETAGTGMDGRASLGKDGIFLVIWLFLDLIEVYPYLNRCIYS